MKKYSKCILFCFITLAMVFSFASILNSVTSTPPTTNAFDPAVVVGVESITNNNQREFDGINLKNGFHK